MHEKYPREGDKTTLPVFVEFWPNGQPRTWGFFTYAGAMVDLAFSQDSEAMIAECVEREFIDADSVTLDGARMVKQARRKGALKVAHKLIELGWADERWPHPVQRGPYEMTVEEVNA